ncbi:serine/threonine-protein kinase 31 [Discoglossus pictus]
MEGDAAFNKVEIVYVSHVEDPVTFWAQSMSRIHDISQLTEKLAKVCPTMSPVFGVPDTEKIYGGLFTADKCWYRCKLHRMLNDEQCAVTYIDYGNSETLSRANIVELPEDLHFSAIAKKYRLWELQLQTSTDFEQGLKFLSTLIIDKRVSVQQRATYKDGTIVAQVLHENIDVGEEILKKGFAEKCRFVNSPNSMEKKMEPSNNIKLRCPFPNKRFERPLREPRSLQSPNQYLNDLQACDSRREKHSNNNVPIGRLKSLPNMNGENGVKHDQKLLEENKQLKEQRDVLLQKSNELECQIKKLKLELEKEKELSEEAVKELEKDLQMAIGMKLKSLTSKIEILKTVRRENENMHFGDDLLETIRVVTDEKLSAPPSLATLEQAWIEYNFAQELIQNCSDKADLEELIANRNKLQKSLHSSVENFIFEADQLPIDERTTTLQSLLHKLCLVYGTPGDSESEDVEYEQFFSWKQAKMEQFSCVRNDTNNSLGVLSEWFSSIREFFDLTSDVTIGSSEVVRNIDDIFDNVESDISKELEISLVEQDEAEKKIILHAYNRVVKQIHGELELIKAITSKYSSSVENSSGLLSVSLERDLLDAKPMKELSSKRPLVQASVHNRMVLLKGYSVGVDTEENIIKRTAKYHQAWSELKEDSGLMQLIYIFFCKSDPLVYLMIPFYPGGSLSSVQAQNSLNAQEIVDVMKGVVQGLQTLHGADIVVGSLHENNIFVINRKKGIIGDFDFTKDAEQRSSVSSVGYPYLIAPEIKLGNPVSKSTDIYAYGCILLRLCIGNNQPMVKEDGIIDVCGLELAEDLEDLLSKLLCSGDRMQADQVKDHIYFQMSETGYNTGCNIDGGKSDFA